MLTEQERQECIAGIERLPQELEAAVDGLDDDQLDTPYRDGGWTPRQVVHHLADSHMNAVIRMKLILAEEHPTLKPYDQDAWAVLPDSAMPVAPSLELLRGLHARWGALLRATPADAWGRTAWHPENGEMMLDGLLASYGAHGSNHVSQITGLRAERGW